MQRSTTVSYALSRGSSGPVVKLFIAIMIIQKINFVQIVKPQQKKRSSLGQSL